MGCFPFLTPPLPPTLPPSAPSPLVGPRPVLKSQERQAHLLRSAGTTHSQVRLRIASRPRTPRAHQPSLPRGTPHRCASEPRVRTPHTQPPPGDCAPARDKAGAGGGHRTHAYRVARVPRQSHFLITPRTAEQSQKPRQVTPWNLDFVLALSPGSFPARCPPPVLPRSLLASALDELS